MALDPDEKVGDFKRPALREVFEDYRNVLRRAYEDAGADESSKAVFRKRLARLEELKNQWTAAWLEFGSGQAWGIKEQEDRDNDLLQIEAQLARHCPHIFEITYYRSPGKQNSR